LFGPQNVRSSHNNGKTEANYGLEKEIDYNQIREEREEERGLLGWAKMDPTWPTQ